VPTPLYRLIRLREITLAAAIPTGFAMLGLTGLAGFVTVVFALTGFLLITRRKRDRLFLAGSLELDAGVGQIERTRRLILELVNSNPEAAELSFFRNLPGKLEEIADRSFRIGRAMKILDLDAIGPGEPDLAHRREGLEQMLDGLVDALRISEIRVRSILARVALGGDDVDEAARSLRLTLGSLDEALGDILQAPAPSLLVQVEGNSQVPVGPSPGIPMASPLKLYQQRTGTSA